jgi:hypothetical protein
VHSDRGGEYNGLKKYLDDKGILLEMSAGYCPESNGIAERYTRTINEKVRSMLSKHVYQMNCGQKQQIMRIIYGNESRPDRQMAYV